MANNVSASAILTIAIALLSMGMNYLQSGQISTGIICIVVGFGLIWATVILFEKGVISKFEKKFAKK
jgi:hypothetical protein